MTSPDASRRDSEALTPERWAQVRALVEGAVALAPEARAEFLATSCGGDDPLRRRVERLVAACDRASGDWGFLAEPAGELAAPLVVAGESTIADAAPAAFCAALADRYAVGAQLGRGGMATVYAAEDLRHRRRVAIKVLDPQLGAMLGADRFLAEIRVTAGLQHPNLLPLFDSGEACGLLYYVMPLIEGSTLRERLRRERQLPLDETVRIVCAVASALDYAHRHGVVHRDLKPENILLQDGQPLVADFGIALAVSNAGGARVTQTGLSLGTPQYMSPEQATGDRVIDGRSDVYSLAAVAYETLAGHPPHVGSTIQAVIARVLTERPPSVRVVRPAVPEHVDFALQRALEKLPADRWSTAAAFATALSTATVAAPRRAWPSVRRSLPWVAIPFAVAAGVWLNQRVNTMPAAHPVAQLTVTLPPDLQLNRVPGEVGFANSRVAIAPNGALLVLAATRVGATRLQLYLRPLHGTELTPIQGTEGGDQPFFSPDGAWIGFMQDGRLRKVPTAGGAPVTIAELPDVLVNGLSWGPGDVIVFGRAFGPLMQLGPGGGAARAVAWPDTIAAEAFRYPQILPDGKTVLATRSIPQGGTSVVAVTLATGDTTTVVEGATEGRYVNAGNGDLLLYVVRDGTVMAAPFDLRRRRISEPAVPIATASGFGGSNIAVALNGTFAFRRGVPMRRELVIREVDGTLTTLTAAGVRQYRTARFSPDGKQIAAGVHNGADVLADIWTYDMERRMISRFTFDGKNNGPEYSKDGQWISYNSLVRPTDRELLRKRVGGGTPETVLAAPGQQHEGMITPDGATLVYRDINARTYRDIWAVDLTRPAGERLASRRPLAATVADEFGIALSPDGQWLAFTSSAASERTEVFVRPLADRPERWQVTASGGGEARWDPSGRELFYRNRDTLFSVAIERAPAFRLGARRVVFIDAFQHLGVPAYDVSRDGRFLLMRDLEAGRVSELTVVQHALDALDGRGRKRRP